MTRKGLKIGGLLVAIGGFGLSVLGSLFSDKERDETIREEVAKAIAKQNNE